MLAPRLDGFLREILDPPFEVLQASVQNSQSNIVHKLMTQIHQFQDICAWETQTLCANGFSCPWHQSPSKKKSRQNYYQNCWVNLQFIFGLW